MAKFYPSMEEIKRLPVQPTDGEWELLCFLEEYLEGKDDFEIFFQPYIDGLNPDVIILRENHGVIIIEVKDYDLNSYKAIDYDTWGVVSQDV